MTQPLPGIEHVVLLMLENRSFDNIFGGYNAYLQNHGLSAQVNGLTGTEVNPTSDGGSVQVFQLTDVPEATVPSPDPGESYDDMTAQIYGYTDGVPNTDLGTPTMKGFVINYSDQSFVQDASTVMTYFGEPLVAVSWLAGLMGAVSDTWYAAAPTQTYANRVMSICAIPGDYQLDVFGKTVNMPFVNDADFFIPVLSTGIPTEVNSAYGAVSYTSIFELFDQKYLNPATPNWKIYYHDTALSSLVAYVNQQWTSSDPAQTSSVNICHFDDSDYPLPPGYATFKQDVSSGTLPMFSIIEPRYYANWTPSGLSPNSNHPGSVYASLAMANGGINNTPAISILDGEALLLDVIATLVEYGALDNTLLVVTYDEHGGIYDHVAPPTSVPSPFTIPLAPLTFSYDRLGVRVPAIFIGGGVAPGTVFRPATGQPYPWFDHTSLIKTLWEQFDLAGPLTPRDSAVSDLTGLISTTNSDARAKRDALRSRLDALRR
jgi:phospholipase C